MSFVEKFPVLNTRRLLLRQLIDNDKYAILRNFSDREVTRWFFDDPFTELKQAEDLVTEFNQHFSEGVGITWAINLLDDPDVIGTCGFDPYQKGGRGEIGFDLAQAYWGRGIMSEALRAVIGFGFDHLLLQGIDADTYSDNKRSIILLERLNFTKLELVEDYYKFSLKPKDWRTEK